MNDYVFGVLVSSDTLILVEDVHMYQRLIVIDVQDVNHHRHECRRHLIEIRCFDTKTVRGHLLVVDIACDIDRARVFVYVEWERFHGKVTDEQRVENDVVRAIVVGGHDIQNGCIRARRVLDDARMIETLFEAWLIFV